MQNQKIRATQKQGTRIKLTPQQLLNGKVTEMPIEQLEEFVRNNIDENPALEEEPSDNYEYESGNSLTEIDKDPQEPYDYPRAQEEDLPPILPNTDGRERVFRNPESFYDKLKEQIGEHDLTEKQEQIIHYLIGSLDNDGLLRKSLETLSDEMAVYENLDATPQEIEEMLTVLQSFDPAGIGAQSLQQCLAIQIDRKKDGTLKKLMETVVNKYFDDFLKNHWQKLQNALKLDDEQREQLQKELRKLNPKPGSSLGETQGFSIHRIIPDFIIETTDDGKVTFSLNRGHLPELTVAPSYIESMAQYKKSDEAYSFMKKGVDSAKGLIEAIRQRQHTLTITMAAIIKRQYKYFQYGDEDDIKPMRLKDIAEDTGLDISTISRVTNEKYAQTRWGIFRLRFFFSERYTTDTGEELSTRKIKQALKDIIDNEDKSRPLSDSALEKEMGKRGFGIARRTIVKYRSQLGIPKASLRKK